MDVFGGVVPDWFLVLMFLALPARWGFVRWRSRLRRRENRCQACGYDLRATPGRCPECGAAAGRWAIWWAWLHFT